MNSFKKQRELAGLKQTDVAAHLGILQTSVSMWETGDAKPRAEFLPKIAALYNCTIDDLFGVGEASGTMEAQQ